MVSARRIARAETNMSSKVTTVDGALARARTDAGKGQADQRQFASSELYKRYAAEQARLTQQQAKK